jgi:hypothetical protein
MRSSAGLKVALLAAGLILALTGCARRGDGARPAGPPTLRAAGLAMGGSWTDAQVRRYASQFDVVVVGASAGVERVRLFHETRPGLLVLAYTCGFDVHDETPLYAWIRDQHPGWFLTDVRGRRLRAYRDPHRWALDCGLPEVRAFLADSARRRVRAIGADGIFEDNVMPTWDIRNLAAGAPRLARYATRAEWRAALDLYLEALERAVEPSLVAANQVTPWTRHARIVAIEEMPAGGARWEVLVRGLARVARDTARVPLLIHHLDGPDDPERAFVTASYLMAAGPGALLCLPYDGPRDSVCRLPEQSLALGRPLGAARQLDGVWWRDFERARILVNPTSRARPAPWPPGCAGGGPLLPALRAGIAWRSHGPAPAPPTGPRPADPPQPRLPCWVQP